MYISWICVSITNQNGDSVENRNIRKAPHIISSLMELKKRAENKMKTMLFNLIRDSELLNASTFYIKRW